MRGGAVFSRAKVRLETPFISLAEKVLMRRSVNYNMKRTSSSVGWLDYPGVTHKPLSDTQLAWPVDKYPPLTTEILIDAHRDAQA
jgi:hypothetical protein